ncbi:MULTISPECIES: ALQxL family class IV lanthipeptide [Streptomyces]|uniref:ALQxL family class IV lanthipeptide n=1 Tax=Streptomyces lonegramiae TaxID=3075524 RepID=A0ABU2XQE8_9ACTN|nr:ALQxL family class IV lanthipeptide [Streptomyces sp. DSM 41529]MDT0547048.1 ALQxL family class IV lanthipeptide [Streptomyces sp. DSM 41529]
MDIDIDALQLLSGEETAAVCTATCADTCHQGGTCTQTSG